MAGDNGVGETFPEQLLDQFERDVTLQWSHRLRLLVQALDLLEEQNRTEEAQRVRWEGELFGLQRHKLERELSVGSRFGPSSRFEDSTVFTEKALAYYEERLKETENQTLRSWYADFLWEKTKNHLAAGAAIEAYHECYLIFAEHESWDGAADSLVRALRLALQLNDDRLIKIARVKVIDGLTELGRQNSHPQMRYCLPLVDIILQLDRRIRRKELERALSISRKGQEFYASKAAGWNYHLARDFAAREAKILGKSGRQNDAQDARVRIGEYYEEEAERTGVSNMLAATHLQDAQRHYAEIGCSEKVEELKVKIRDRLRAAAEKGEFKGISVMMEFPVKEIENQARQLLKDGLDEALINLASDPYWIPDMEESRRIAREIEQEHPIQTIFPQSTIRGTRQVHLAATEAEIHEANVIKYYRIDVGIRSMALDHTLKVFIEEGGLTESSLVDYLAGSPFIDDDAVEFISVGVERYFKGDFVSSLHILVPRLEETLRRTIGKLGVSTTSLGREGVTKEKQLRDVLDTPELEDLLGDRIVFYLKHMLISQLGENLRHDTAHGLLTSSRCTRELTEQVIQLYLLLTPFLAKSRTQA